ncbi:MAG: hypothetical protein ABIX01_11900 [Chitinophagaceae bacterium]
MKPIKPLSYALHLAINECRNMPADELLELLTDFTPATDELATALAVATSEKFGGSKFYSLN